MSCGLLPLPRTVCLLCSMSHYQVQGYGGPQQAFSGSSTLSLRLGHGPDLFIWKMIELIDLKRAIPSFSSPGNTNRSPLTIMSLDCHLRRQRHGSEQTVTRLCSELGAPTSPEHSSWIVVECLFILSANIPEQLGTVARRQGRSTRGHQTPSEVRGTERP